jgi:hypothetical protein
MSHNHHPLELANLWKRYWILAIVVLAAVIGLGVGFRSVLCAYSRSHHDYLTSRPTLAQPARLS